MQIVNDRLATLRIAELRDQAERDRQVRLTTARPTLLARLLSRNVGVERPLGQALKA